MADIGSTLREARMRSHIDISEVETATKIRAKYLRALENEEWDLLPGPVYIKSFLRTYGDYLGLDTRMLIDDFKYYNERPSDHELRPGSLGRERERRARTRPRIPPWFSIVVVAAVVVGILYAVGSLNENGSTTPPPTHPATTAHTTPTHSKTHSNAPPAKPKPKKVNLHMVATGTVYVCLVNAIGTKLINEQDYAAGQPIPDEHGHKLLLTLGNNSITLKVNGKPVPVAPSASPIRLLITPKRTTHISLSQKPTCP
jgi:cytoskeletal protein RodZ